MLDVSGGNRGSGSALIVGVRVAGYATNRPDGFAAPRADQTSGEAPGLDLDPAALDGLGNEGDRGRGAIEWALSRLGDPAYNGWCLKFVANAFGAPAAGFYSAQVAANQLRPQGAAAGVAAAPAGALVFFSWGVYGHVGISLGDGRMVHAGSVVKVDAVPRGSYWGTRYLGWVSAPGSWPGRPPAAPAPQPAAPPAPAAQPAPSTSPAPSAPAGPARRVLTVDNRVTNGMGAREDPIPVRLTTQPWTYCGRRGCNINGTERGSGGTYDAAVCQRSGERTTNGNDGDPADDGNPIRFESTRYYGVRLADGTFGLVSEVWIRASDRGGLGLPSC